MAKIPQKPEDIFEEFTGDVTRLYGSELESIILYGSGARGEYIPKKSDINFMIVLSENGINSLGKAIPLVAKWHKRNVGTPLFVTKAYIESSMDTFPIEFLNFKAAYKVVFGKDILQGLTFNKQYIRLQCERELKGKLLQLRERFLETEGKRRLIEELIARSLPTFFSIFQAILMLQDKTPAADRGMLLAEMAQDAGLHRELFIDLAAIKEGKKKLSSSEAVPLVERYIEEVRKLALFVDGLKM